ncbi:MAG: hypothetical protein QW542_01350 [Thermoproteota archaeon]
MSKQNAIDNLNSLKRNLAELEMNLRKVKSTHISKELKSSVQNLAKKWFEEVEPVIQRYISEEVKAKYHDFFTTLLKFSLKKSIRKNSCLKLIDEIIHDLEEDILIPILKSTGQVLAITHLSKILENTNEEEEEYLNEALGCAANGFFRASIVLAWNAAVHRMHKVVEKLGFDEFNQKSVDMKNINEGRFKRFKKSFNIHSLSELRSTVFDNDLLWVLEYWGLIDSNQHDRLSLCLTMRNNSAHPGEAPITEENLVSFYSDLKNIVFCNPKFRL